MPHLKSHNQLPINYLHLKNLMLAPWFRDKIALAQRDYFGAHTYERTDRPRGQSGLFIVSLLQSDAYPHRTTYSSQ